MIKIENIEVKGWGPAVRGMRNPKNSWGLSDSKFDLDCEWISCEDCPVRGDEECVKALELQTCDIGPNDHKLMMSLAKGGPVHAKYRRMIVVYMDITAPLYWWKEFDTYKVGTVANSCSTMHKIQDKEFTLDDFSHEHLLDISLDESVLSPLAILKELIKTLNHWREHFVVEEKINEILEIDKKDMWWQMIQLLASSYNQKRTVMLSYEVLHNMYFSREYHKLDEWRILCEMIRTLPYSEIITTKAREEIDIYKDLIEGKISLKQARKELGLDPIKEVDINETYRL